MLQLKNIVKDYVISGGTVHALRDVSVTFRLNEFVSVLGPSGCGKTTLLNIVGGLDRFTEGELIINGIKTDRFTDKDWDSYRNHTVGFVFQSYNLISHLSVLGNVELALTLSGFGKKERREKALAALAKVGLLPQADKMPNQLSGGQMQRVAIARAIVNDPAIILADEPTGALDSETSVTVMDILKEIAADRLVIMVTHNPDLAETYSTRIIKLFDGQKVEDSNPYEPTQEELEREETAAKEAQKQTKAKPRRRRSVMGHTNMSFFTAISLSFRNLFSKRGRTTMVSVAGSIGIIGIALIMSLSQGLNDYIARFEQDTLSNYPITITSQTAQFSDMMATFMNRTDGEGERYPKVDVEKGLNTKVGVSSLMFAMIDSLGAGVYANDLKSFKAYVEQYRDVPVSEGGIKGQAQAIQYSYNTNINIYGLDNSYYGYTQLNPLSAFSLEWDFKELLNKLAQDTGTFNWEGILAKLPELQKMSSSVQSLQSYGSVLTETISINMWQEMIDNNEYIRQQYDVLYGELSDDPYGAVLVVDSYNRIPDVTLFSLNYLDQSDLIKYFLSKMTDEKGEPLYEPDGSIVPEEIDFEELMGLRFKLMIDPDYYGTSYQEGNVYTDHRSDHEYISDYLQTAETLRISAILRPKEGVTAGLLSAGGLYYSSKLVQKVVDKVSSHPLVVVQQALPKVNILNGGAEFDALEGESYEQNLKLLGMVDEDVPTYINIYPAGFKEKEVITAFIDKYNQDKQAKAASLHALAAEYAEAGNLEKAAEYELEATKQESMVIRYNDMIGSIISTISIIIDAVSYVLIAFISISLIVSSVMIGIITTISVLERTKEIGVLRAIGASKHDVTTIFNAETMLIGLFAGLIGVIFTAIINIPITLIVSAFTGPMVKIVARLPIWGALALVGVSVVLTLIAGLIPARGAAKKDPVIALRSE